MSDEMKAFVREALAFRLDFLFDDPHGVAPMHEWAAIWDGYRRVAQEAGVDWDELVREVDPSPYERERLERCVNLNAQPVHGPLTT